MNSSRVNQRRPSHSVAFTLPEVLVSITLVVIVFIGLYGGISAGFSVTQVARENLRATQIMVERMEGIRLYNWNQLVYSNMIPTAFTNYYYPFAVANESKGRLYSGTITITNVSLNPPASYSNDMRLITVKVYWTNSNGRSNSIVRSRTMQTYVGRMGVQNYVYYN